VPDLLFKSDPPERAGAILTVDLAVLAENWRILNAKTSADCGAVVKADGYGLGVEPVTRTLLNAGCRTFYVSHLDEGAEVRTITGPKPRIVVMHGPNPGTERDFINYGLIPVLNTPQQIRHWRGFVEDSDDLAETIVQVDTGMGRLGLTPREFDEHMADPMAFSGLLALALMSHLACAPEPDHPLNLQQREAFASKLAAFQSKYPDAKGTLANSSGLFLGPPWHHDMARPGAALYGLNPRPGQPNPMIPVVRLRAKVLQVRRIDTSQTVGYGATYTAPDGARIATVSVGYADGLHRSLSNAGYGLLDDIRVPVAGRVSMDLMSFDVSDVPEAAAQPGAMIDLIGPHISADDVAREAGTIGYEVLTSLGQRFHRVYPAAA